MLLCMIHMYFLIACTPHVLLLGCLGSILSHDPNQFVGHIGFFQISDLCIRKLQFHGLYRAVDMMQLCGADYRSRHLCEQPGKGNFCHGYAMLSRQLRHSVDDALILLSCGIVFESGIAVFFKAFGCLSGML